MNASSIVDECSTDFARWKPTKTTATFSLVEETPTCASEKKDGILSIRWENSGYKVDGARRATECGLKVFVFSFSLTFTTPGRWSRRRQWCRWRWRIVGCICCRGHLQNCRWRSCRWWIDENHCCCCSVDESSWLISIRLHQKILNNAAETWEAICCPFSFRRKWWWLTLIDFVSLFLREWSNGERSHHFLIFF